MIFEDTELAGAFVIDLKKHEDDRGFFARVFCKKEMEEMNLIANWLQVNNSLSVHKGTLRGLHYQIAPYQETKLIRCIKGSVLDVILDLRHNSKTFGYHFKAELNADNRRMMYVPKGFAHGFITLTDDTEVLYFTDEFYEPTAERIVRYDDPRFGISWPFDPVVISDKDKNAPDFNINNAS